MAKKQETKIDSISYGEILVLAIKQVDAMIEKAECKLTEIPEGAPEDFVNAFRNTLIAPWVTRRSLLAQLFRIETGTDYNVDWPDFALEEE